MAERLPSLRARVVLSTAAVSALVGLLAAGGAVALVRQQQHLDADRRLRDSGLLFAGELSDTDDRVEQQVADENSELGPLGLRLALFEDSRCLGGDASLAEVSGCVDLVASRACAVELGKRRVVVAGPPLEAATGWWLLPILLATLLSAVVGAAVSFPVTSWALTSLLALQQRVSGAGPLELEARASTAEVESLRAALEALIHRLSEALERSRVFASSAAHELRTPLATMSAELELLSTNAAAPEREAAHRVLRTLKRLSLLVDRLLELARGDLGPQRPFETLALEDVVRETMGARDETERSRVHITIDDAGMIRGDEALVGAIVDNLVDNSLKFTSAAVQVQVSATGNGVTLTVTDGGAGVSAEQVPSLIKPFARGDTSVRGHGLGLAIVNRAVELHEARLSFEGSTIRVTFPRWSPS